MAGDKPCNTDRQTDSAVQEAHVTVTVTVSLRCKMLLRESHSYNSRFHLCLWGVQSPHPGYPVCTSAVQEAHVTVTVTVMRGVGP